MGGRYFIVRDASVAGILEILGDTSYPNEATARRACPNGFSPRFIETCAAGPFSDRIVESVQFQRAETLGALPRTGGREHGEES